AVGVIFVLGILLATGAKSSARFNSIIVCIKLAAVALFIGVAMFHINPANWSPFIPPQEAIPNASASAFSCDMPLTSGLQQWFATGGGGAVRSGIPGLMVGPSTIFSAYLGFDAVSTSAEEPRNPQRDLPIGILASLTICTVLYIVVSGLLTSVVPFR